MSNEAQARAVIANKKGLHARAAAKVVKTASGYNAQVKMFRLLGPRDSGEAPSAGATSILSLLMLAAERGAEVELKAEGPQAVEAVTEIVNLINRRFDEDE